MPGLPARGRRDWFYFIPLLFLIKSERYAAVGLSPASLRARNDGSKPTLAVDQSNNPGSRAKGLGHKAHRQRDAAGQRPHGRSHDLVAVAQIKRQGVARGAKAEAR